MQNLDIFPKDSVVFKYDLKFSEFNRRHLDYNELEFYKNRLIKLDERYSELIDYSIT